MLLQDGMDGMCVLGDLVGVSDLGGIVGLVVLVGPDDLGNVWSG